MSLSKVRELAWSTIWSVVLGACLAGCAPGGSYVDVETLYTAQGIVPDSLVTDPAQVQITEQDFPDRLYQSLGDIRVRAYRFPITLDTARSDLDWALRHEASKLGADAVIYAKYGRRTIEEVSGFSYDATGTAIRFWDSP